MNNEIFEELFNPVEHKEVMNRLLSMLRQLGDEVIDVCNVFVREALAEERDEAEEKRDMLISYAAKSPSHMEQMLSFVESSMPDDVGLEESVKEESGERHE